MLKFPTTYIFYFSRVLVWSSMYLFWRIMINIMPIFSSIKKGIYKNLVNPYILLRLLSLVYTKKEAFLFSLHHYKYKSILLEWKKNKSPVSCEMENILVHSLMSPQSLMPGTLGRCVHHSSASSTSRDHSPSAHLNLGNTSGPIRISSS